MLHARRRQLADGGGNVHGTKTSRGTSVSRYHPLLVTLHWVIAAMIVGMLIAGLWLARAPNADPQKLTVLLWHMSAGMLILALMIIRFVVRLASTRPAPATSGSRVLDGFATVVHHGFYLLVLLMASSGLATAILAGLNRIVFQGSGEPLPARFADYPPFTAHAIGAALLVFLIVLHIVAALYHQFVRKDALLQRMTFGARTERPH
jgi:cytochrome b561